MLIYETVDRDHLVGVAVAIVMVTASHRAYHAAITGGIHGTANLGCFAGLRFIAVSVWPWVAWGELVPSRGRGRGLLLGPRLRRALR